MSNIAIKGATTGTGVFTIESPATNTDRTLTLPDEAGTVLVNGTTSNVGIGTSSPDVKLDVYSTTALGHARIDGPAGINRNLNFSSDGSNRWNIYTTGSAESGSNAGSDFSIARYSDAGSYLGTALTITRADGSLLVGKTSTSLSVAGALISDSTTNHISTNGLSPLQVNRNTNDGQLIGLYQAGVGEGAITVSGTTVSYTGGHLSRWAQTLTPKDELLVKGTVLSNLDEMNVYVAPTTYWTEEDEVPEGVNVGDVKVAEHQVDNEQLNKVKVSDVEGDANVAGVFVNWAFDEAHNVDEINMAMTGDMIIRIAAGTTVARGDLLMSAGDGTAKPQGDDIVRSKTIAKVTSTNVTCTYADGSYCVPCVLMAC